MPTRIVPREPVAVPSSQRVHAIAANTGAARLASASAARHAVILRALAATAALLCLGVVVLGAYVRLSNAGLGCPDWPGCYGHVTPLGAAADSGLALRRRRHLRPRGRWRSAKPGARWCTATPPAPSASLLVLIAALGFLWRRERIASPVYLAALLAIVAVQAALGMLTVTLAAHAADRDAASAVRSHHAVVAVVAGADAVAAARTGRPVARQLGTVGARRRATTRCAYAGAVGPAGPRAADRTRWLDQQQLRRDRVPGLSDLSGELVAAARTFDPRSFCGTGSTSTTRAASWLALPVLRFT